MFVTSPIEPTKDCPWADVHVLVHEPTAWTHADVVVGLRALERIRRETDAASAVLLAALPDDRDAVTSLARDTGISHREARRRRDIAAVVGVVASARELLASGAVSSEHVASLRSVLDAPEAAALVQSAVHLSPEAFAAEVQQFRLSVEHGANTVARQRALRRLSFFPGPEGMVGINGLLPPLEGATLKASLADVVDARWRHDHPKRASELGGHGGDSREQRTADALLELTGIIHSAAVAGAAAGHPRTTGNTITATKLATAKPATVVVFDIDRYEAELLDHGPVPVTDLLFDETRASLYALFTDGRGEVLKFARGRREPSVSQRLAVLARDRRCVYPNCHAPPSKCSIHHFDEWLQDHGCTDVEVLGLLCEPHHRHIHLGNLKATRETDGAVAVRDRTTGLIVARASPRRIAA